MASAKRRARKAAQRGGYRSRYGIGVSAKGHDAEKRPPRGWTEVHCPSDKLFLKPSQGSFVTKCGKCRKVYRKSRAGW